MAIIILSFGPIADIISKSEMKVAEINSTDELHKKLVELFPALSSVKYSIAVNRKLIQKNTELTDGDTVALLPPFSGG